MCFRFVCASHCVFVCLNDMGATTTPTPPSVFFFFHPFANIGSAILKLHALRFATYEKAHYIAMDYANAFQI